MATKTYRSPLGMILIQADEQGITNLRFVDQPSLANDTGNSPYIKQAVSWLDQYFHGDKPYKTPTLHVTGTRFQQRVWQQLLKVPYGSTVTYGQLAEALGVASPQAIGHTVGQNPVLLIIPCHRVVGANGRLTGYSGGLERKRKLLDMEKRLR